MSWKIALIILGALLSVVSTKLRWVGAVVAGAGGVAYLTEKKQSANVVQTLGGLNLFDGLKVDYQDVVQRAANVGSETANSLGRHASVPSPKLASDHYFKRAHGPQGIKPIDWRKIRASSQ